MFAGTRWIADWVAIQLHEGKTRSLTDCFPENSEEHDPVPENPIDIAAMLKASFTKAEREHLNSHPAFHSQLEKTKTTDDYSRLCELAEQLLGADHHTNPAAQQLRRDSNPGG
jgi:hypothetical protein